MRQPNSGSTLPTAAHTWAVADQSLLANSSYAPAHIGCQGARVGNAVVIATPRGAMPGTAAGAWPSIVAYCDADDFVTLRISNNNANATAPLTVPLIIDLMVLPINP